MSKGTGTKLLVMALADQAINDNESGKLSIIGIFEKISVKNLPASHQKMVIVVSLLGKENQMLKLSLNIVRPSGDMELQTNISLKLGTNGKANFVTSLEGFPLKELGTYRFKLIEGEVVLGEVPLEIVRIIDDDKPGNIN